MTQGKELSGERFGKIVVLSFSGLKTNDGHRLWNCRCDCGKTLLMHTQKLRRRGERASCGCGDAALRSKASRRHGGFGTRLYRIYYGIKTRVYNSKDPNYALYGARGIGICTEWDKSFVAFREWALQNGYADDLSIDRIDVNGDYEPANCRWSTAKEQGQNRRTNRYLTVNGESKTLTEWAKETGLSPTAIRSRIRAGKTVTEALSIPAYQCRLKEIRR